MSVDELYRSANLAVRVFPAADRSRWVVTFANYASGTSLDREGFGERFLQSRGLSTISVIGSGDHWYQYPDMAAALVAIRAAVAGAERVLTYGSSMGGYAAIRFADAIGAHACLALSPQYSNDPKKVPFEGRWPQEARAIAWRAELDGPIRCAVAPIVAYDDRGVDARHAALIAADTPIAAIPISYAAHPVTTYLSSAGLLEGAVIAALAGTLDTAALRAAAARRRHGDPVMVSELARLQPRHRPRLGIALARRALALAPDIDLMCHILARRLTVVGQHDEALPLHARAVALSGGHLGYALPYSEALAAAGEPGRALTVARDLAGEHPGSAPVFYWLGTMLARTDAHGEAVAAFERAHRLDPRNRLYRSTYLLMRAPSLTPLRPLFAPIARALARVAAMLRDRRRSDASRS